MYTNYVFFMYEVPYNTKFFVMICDCDTFLCFDKSLTESLTVLASIPASTFDLGLTDHLSPKLSQ